jgi:hypothetical protein
MMMVVMMMLMMILGLDFPSCLVARPAFSKHGVFGGNEGLVLPVVSTPTSAIIAAAAVSSESAVVAISALLLVASRVLVA